MSATAVSGSPAPLFQSFSLGSLKLPNRFVMSPMTRCFAPGGVPGAPVLDYYRRRARGGVGLIVTEGIGIDHPAALGSSDFEGRNIPVLDDPDAAEAWRGIVDAVHAAGGKIVPQLWHQGVMRPAGTGPYPDHPSSRPSGIWGPTGRRCSLPSTAVEALAEPTEPLTEREIADIIAAYARSAARARALGFDGIALHGAHGYLIDTFLWHETNLRADRYGGDQRTRFAVEVVAAVRAAVGADFPILFRFSQWKQHDFDARLAATPTELEAVLGPIAEAGVDLFDASTRNFDTPAFENSPMSLAGWARKVTGKPSMAVGGVGLDKDLYESLASGGSNPTSLAPLIRRFDEGEFDLVAIGRALIADPEWVNKVRTGTQRSPFNPMMLTSLQ